MKCNVCGKEFGNGVYCQNCGSDVITARGNYNDGGYGVPSQTHLNTISNKSANPLQSHKDDNKNVLIPQNPNDMIGNMICYNCQEVIPPDSIYCPCCGIKLIIKCPKCGHSYSSSYKFCNQCGTNYQEYLKAQSEKEKEKEQKIILDRWFELTGSYNGTGVLISKRDCASGHLVIPDGVTEIAKHAFFECTELTSIVIPDTVTAIGDSAFYGCTGLTSVVIPEGVRIIEEGAFYGCTGLTSVVIPEGVRIIEERVFEGCIRLTSVVIPDGVTQIGVAAFGECTELTSVVIPDSVRTIGTFSFYGCSGLTSFVIPEGLTEIGDGAFSGCTGLISVEIPAKCELEGSSFDSTTEVKRRK